MSDSVPPPPPPPLPPDSALEGEPKQPSRSRRILIILGSVVALIAGIAATYDGIQTMRSAGGDTRRQQLVVESDKAIDEANMDGVDARPVFQGFLNDVDKLGLAAVRAKEKATAQTASDLFGKSSEAFHLAGKKLEEAVERKKSDTLNPYLEAKIQSYDLFAQAADLNREIIRMTLDDSIPDIQTLLPKITEAAKRRDEAEKTAVKISAEATESAKKLK
jgi:hypothetical protein